MQQNRLLTLQFQTFKAVSVIGEGGKVSQPFKGAPTYLRRLASNLAVA